MGFEAMNTVEASTALSKLEAVKAGSMKGWMRQWEF